MKAEFNINNMGLAHFLWPFPVFKLVVWFGPD